MRKIILALLCFNVSTNNIKAQYWSSLGTGIDGVVISLLITDSNMYAGGYFYSAGGVSTNSIAKWDGANWQPIGSGFLDGGVNALAIYSNELYAAGWFYSAGDSIVNNIAKWNGTSWTSVGTGINDIVYSLAVYNNELYAGGWFYSAGDSIVNNIAKWNGTNWSAVGSGLDGGVHAMAVYDGELYVTGNFWSAGDSIVNNIAKWNGTSWAAVGTGLDYMGHTLLEYNHELFVGGVFGSAGGIEVSNIAKWNGTNWSAVGNSSYSVVHSLAVYNGSLYTGGENWIYEGSAQKWDGTNWSVLGTTPNGTFYALAANDSALYAGGAFDNIDNIISANKIARWTDHCTTVPPRPQVIHGDTAVCAGSIQTYSIDPVALTGSYTWILPSTWKGNSATNTITVTTGPNGGAISVFANNNCGSSAEQQIQAAIKPIPLKADTIFGNLFALTGKSETYFVNLLPDATTYTWTIDGGGKVISGQGTNSVNIDWWASGAYTISVIPSNNCGASAYQSLLVKVAAIGAEDPYEIKLFPNPSTGELFLNAKRIQDKTIKIEILNMLGQMVYKNQSSPGTNNYTQLLSLYKLAPGIYTIRIMIDNKIYLRKILKK